MPRLSAVRFVRLVATTIVEFWQKVNASVFTCLRCSGRSFGRWSCLRCLRRVTGL